MAYIYRQKINLLGLAPITVAPRTVLLVEPKVELYGIYSSHLKRHNFQSHHCEHLDFFYPMLTHCSPQLVLINGDLEVGLPRIAETVSASLRQFPSLSVVTMSQAATPEEMKLLMEIGVRSHINRQFSRPRDIVEIVKTILNH